MTTTPYKDALTMIRQLDRLARARLIAELVQELAVLRSGDLQVPLLVDLQRAGRQVAAANE